VFVLTLLPFLPALDGQFLNWDDSVNFLGNTGYRGLGWAQIRWMFTTALMGHYIPVTWLSLAVNYVLGGMNPWGYHLLSLLLHAANAALFYFVARRLLAAAYGGIALTGPRSTWLGHVDSGDKGIALRQTSLTWSAAFAALLFGVHPLRVESVVWVTERRDVVCGLFFLLSVLAYLRGVEPGGTLRGRWRALSLAAFAASLLSKAAAMPLPLALLLLDAFPLRRQALGWRRLLREKAPYAILSAVAAVVALLVLPQAGPVTGYDRYGPLARVAMVGYSLAFYPLKFLWPVGLSPLYELPARVSLTEWRFAASLAAVVAVTVVLVRARRRWPAGLAAWTYSALMLLPVSGVVHSGHQLAHDRYSYLSGLGFAVLGGAAVAGLVAAWRRGRLGPAPAGALSLALLLVLAGWGAGSWRQSKQWRDTETLFQWAVDVDPECAVCNQNLAAQVLYDSPGDPARGREAEYYARRAITLRPELPAAHYDLGLALAAQRRYSEAAAAYRDFIRLEPRSAEGPAALGLLYLDLARYDEALPLLRQALATAPPGSSVPIRIKRAMAVHAEALARAGRQEEAAALAGAAAAAAAQARPPR